MPFLCRYLCQLPLEQLPVASDRDQLSYQPYTDRRTCYFRKSKEANMQWANVCAAAFIIIVPLLLAFLVAQKQFMSSFVSAGIKE